MHMKGLIGQTSKSLDFRNTVNSNVNINLNKKVNFSHENVQNFNDVPFRIYFSSSLLFVVFGFVKSLN